jgi:hypothetical protein
MKKYKEKKRMQEGRKKVIKKGMMNTRKNG